MNQLTTLGELSRNVAELRSDMKDLAKDVTALKIALGMAIDKTRRLEAVVYGALGLAATSAAAAVTTVLAR